MVDNNNVRTVKKLVPRSCQHCVNMYYGWHCLAFHLFVATIYALSVPPPLDGLQ